MVKTNPSPEPRPVPGAPAGKGGGIAFKPPITTPDSSGNVFGIDDQLAGTKVGAGGLFPMPENATVLDAVKAFSTLAHNNPGLAAQIQRRLWLSGYYGSSTTPPTLGVIGGDDLKAFQSAAGTAARTETDLDQMLKQGAQRGQYDGVAAQIAAQLKAREPNVLQKADPRALSHNIDAQFQQMMGRKATPAEKAAFVTAFQAADVHVQQGNIDARNAANAQQQNAIRAAGGIDPNLGDALNPYTPPPRTEFSSDPVTAFRQGEHDYADQSAVSTDDFLRAVAGQESGGNPTERNADSGAYGTFQIMPGNWSSWARQAGLGGNAPQTPGNQEVVARHKLQEYKNKYGSWEAAAAAWYGGEGAAQRFVKNPNDPRLTKKQGKYPSIKDYVAQVMGRTQQPGGVTHDAYEFSTPVTPSVDIPTPTVTQQAFSQEAFTEDYVRKLHPVETQAKDVANTFNSFLSIIGNRA